VLIAAARESRCSEKEIALALGCPDQPYWNKVKNGEKPAPRSPKLHDAPLSMQREYVRRWANHLGMRVADDDARQRALLDLVEAAARALREIA
jgi:hypothetical protein